MAKARVHTDASYASSVEMDGLYPIFIPLVTYRALADAAAERGMTFNQLFSAAVDAVIMNKVPIQPDKKV